MWALVICVQDAKRLVIVDEPHDNCVGNVVHVNALLINKNWHRTSLKPGTTTVKVDVAASAGCLVLFQGVPFASKLEAPQSLAHPVLPGHEQLVGVHLVKSKNTWVSRNTFLETLFNQLPNNGVCFIFISASNDKVAIWCVD